MEPSTPNTMVTPLELVLHDHLPAEFFAVSSKWWPQMHVNDLQQRV
jgi:hypothetical protein